MKVSPFYLAFCIYMFMFKIKSLQVSCFAITLSGCKSNLVWVRFY